MRTQVIIRHQVPGFHYWPGAPDETSYLRMRHRHVFHIAVAFEVKHDDRDVEYHAAQLALRDGLKLKSGEYGIEFGAKSCETIAKEILDKMYDEIKRWPLWVEVSEDGEFTSRVEV